MYTVRSCRAALGQQEQPRWVPRSGAPLQAAPPLHTAVCVQGCRAVVCMPTNSPEIKIAAVQRLGGEVELVRPLGMLA